MARTIYQVKDWQEAEAIFFKEIWKPYRRMLHQIINRMGYGNQKVTTGEEMEKVLAQLKIEWMESSYPMIQTPTKGQRNLTRLTEAAFQNSTI